MSAGTLIRYPPPTVFSSRRRQRYPTEGGGATRKRSTHSGVSNSVTLELGTALIGCRVDNNIVRAQARDVFRCSGLSRPDAAEAPPILWRGAGDLFPLHHLLTPWLLGGGGGGGRGSRRGEEGERLFLGVDESSLSLQRRSLHLCHSVFFFVVRIAVHPPPSATCRHGTGLRHPSSNHCRN